MKNKQIVASFSALILLVVLVVTSIFWAYGQIATSAAARKHTFIVLNKADDFMSALKDAETGQRGYLLTGKETFLQPYLEAQGSIRGKLKDLRQLGSISGARKHLDTIGSLVDAKMAEMLHAITLRRNNSQSAALAVVADGQGKRLMDLIRAEMRSFIQIEEGVLAQHDAEYQSNMLRLFTTIVFASVLMVLCTLSFAYFIYRLSQQKLKNLIHLETVHLLEIQEETNKQLQHTNVALQESDETMQRLFNELEISKIETEAQNAELQRSQNVLENQTIELEMQNDDLRLAREAADQLETVLRESEDKLAVTLISIGDGVIATDVKARVTLLNQIAEHLTGWTEAEAIGQPVEEIFHIINKDTRLPTAIPIMEAIVNGAIQGLANHTVLIARDGSEYDIADSCAPIRNRDDQVIGAVLVFRNVTEEYAIQQSLRDSSTLVQTIFNSVVDGIITIHALDDIIETVNRAAEQMFGYTATELTGQNLGILIPELDRDQQNGSIEYYSASDEARTQGLGRELIGRRKDGSIFPVEISVSEMQLKGHRYFTCILRDITPRKRAEEALLEAGALQSAIFNSANFSSIATDAKGVIQIFNVGAEQMLGYTAAEVMNKITPADISDPMEVIARAKALSAELETLITPGFEALVYKASRGIEDIYELTYIRKDGSRFPAVVSVTALRDAQDTIIGYLLIGTDNTARLNLVNRLKASNDELQCQQMELENRNRQILEVSNRADEAMDRLKLATMIGGVGIWEYDLIDGSLVWDDQMYRLYGIDKNSFSGVFEAGRACLHPEDAVREDDNVRMAISGEKDYKTEFRVVWPDGSVHNIQAVGVVKRDASGQAVRMVGTNWDITSLLKAGALQSAIFSSANFSSIATDAKGVIQIFNVGAENMLGYTAAEVVNTITPADISDPQEIIARAKTLSVELDIPIAPGFEALAFKASRGIEDIYELTYIRKDGSRFPAVVSVTALRDSQSAIIGYLLIGTDNTARKQIESEQLELAQRLRDHQYYTRSLFESNIDAIMTTDPSCIITDVNRQMEVLTSSTRDELIGAPFRNFFTDPERAESVIKKVLMDKKVTNYELTACARGGKETVVSFNATTFYDRERKLQGVFAAARDITERKQLDRELECAKSVAERANLAKSDFLSSMSHELRTPLSAILGFAQLLESGSPQPTPAQKRSVDQILQAGWYLLELINEILDLALIESGKLSMSLEAVSLPEIMHECEALIEPQAKKRGISVNFIRFDTPGFVIADRIRLKQVLINLLSNAIKYNRVGGKVVVDSVLCHMNTIRISVRDTGEGLTPEQLAQLFQPFNRLGQEANSEQGTGIGLTVSKRLIESMGGVIGVDSTVGKGSVFWIELELTIKPQQIIACVSDLIEAPSVQVQENAQLYTLLYVEDNPANLMLVEDIIARRSDIRLLSARDGISGIELARAFLPDVILMDINLPGISGLQTLKILAEDSTTAHIPVVALSANAIPRDIENGLKAGFFRYLTKPIKVNEFMDTLDVALNYAKEEANFGG